MATLISTFSSVHVAAGDELVSGGINKSGRIVAVALREAGESTASRIIRAVEEASESKPRMENFITRFARVYTPAVMVLTLLVAVIPPLMGLGEWKEWIHRGLLLLVISCPCALVISVPMGFFGGDCYGGCSNITISGGNVIATGGNNSAGIAAVMIPAAAARIAIMFLAFIYVSFPLQIKPRLTRKPQRPRFL